MQLSDAHVLVIDDNPQTRTLLAEMLGGAVASVRHCSDAIFGLALWLETRAQLVFVDYEMPELKGPTFIKLLRRQEEVLGLRTAVLMITGHSDRDRVMAALEAGVDDFIVKPLSPAEVLSRGAQVLAALDAGKAPGSVFL